MENKRETTMINSRIFFSKLRSQISPITTPHLRLQHPFDDLRRGLQRFIKFVRLDAAFVFFIGDGANSKRRAARRRERANIFYLFQALLPQAHDYPNELPGFELFKDAPWKTIRPFET